jgi:hypothetical protein
LKGKYKNIFKEIQKSFSGKAKEFKTIRYFPYGFDELFLNKYIYPIVKKYKRIIAFEIGLGMYGLVEKKIINIANKEKYSKLYWDSWKLKLDKQSYKFIVDKTNEIYKKTKEFDEKDTRLEMFSTCIKQYEENIKYIIPISDEAGISAFVIKKPNQD